MRLSSAFFSCSSLAHSPAPIPPHAAASSAAFHAARTAAQHRRTGCSSASPAPSLAGAAVASTFLSQRPSLPEGGASAAGGGAGGGVGAAEEVFLSQRLSLLLGSPCACRATRPSPVSAPLLCAVPSRQHYHEPASRDTQAPFSPLAAFPKSQKIAP